jgi:hypothetical protein
VPFTVTVVLSFLALRYGDCPLIPGLKDGIIRKLQQAVGSTLVVGGLALLIASNVAFHHQGQGTLLPLDRPRHLVVTGVFR